MAFSRLTAKSDSSNIGSARQNMHLPKLLFIPLFTVLLATAHADSILLTNGETLKGTILRRDQDNVVIGLDYGVLRYNVQLIKSVNGKAIPQSASATAPVTSPNHFPKWKDVVGALSSQSWATDFRQIPATVIDKGVMRNVPYISFKCAGDYEMNIYGDPDNPAGVEIGVYRALLTNEAAKKNCVEFIASILGDKLSRDVLRVMDRRKSLFEKDGLSLEITPETDEDAYGGWWVSAYKEKALDAARATDAEVASISVVRTPAFSTKVEADSLAWSSADMKYARVQNTVPTQSASNASVSQPIANPPGAATSTDTDYSGGRVYVRGYYRKDGTYVNGYTRRK